MERGRPKRFGQTSQHERETLRSIIFLRKKNKSFTEIANRLNALGQRPRRAEEWNSQLVFHVFKQHGGSI